MLSNRMDRAANWRVKVHDQRGTRQTPMIGTILTLCSTVSIVIRLQFSAERSFEQKSGLQSIEAVPTKPSTKIVEI